MAGLIRLDEAKAHVHEYVRGGRCKDDPEVVKAINDAVRVLLQEGDWKGTVMPLKLAVYNGIAHLPRGFSAAMRVNICGNVSDVWHEAYEYAEPGPGDLDCMVNSLCEPIGLVDRGEHGTFWPLWKPLRIAATSTHAEDAGLTLKVYGQCGPYREQVMLNAGASGSGESISIFRWENGVHGEIAQTDLDANLGQATFTHIDSMQKPLTKGYVTVFGYDPVTHDIQYLAKLHPQEIEPRYRWYKLPGVPMMQGVEVNMLVKRDYVPAIFDDDVLVIQNLDAILSRIKAQNEMTRGSFQLGQMHHAEALRLLRSELKNYKRGQKVLDVRMEGGYVIGDEVNLL